jgi:3-hydroxyisobutyrate dehydrogenase-like beta-hydroxyacid dehydrogenase
MRLAFLGLGIMGSRMAANLVRAGHDVNVWNRTAATADAFALAHPSAHSAPTPRDAATDVEIVLTMVVDAPQVERVLLGEDGAADGARPGTLFIDCSTIGPAAARVIGDTLGNHGFGFLDAPVTGSSPRTENGTLTFMVGGDRADLERARPVLEAMGALIVYAGELGQGQLVKVISNTVAAANATTLGQALLAAASAGADLDALVAVMAAGSGGSAMLDLKGGPMREHDYTALSDDDPEDAGRVGVLFKLDQMLKDVRLCLETVSTPFPAGEAAERVLTEAAELGHGQDDFASLIDVLERGAGIRLDDPNGARTAGANPRQ